MYICGSLGTGFWEEKKGKNRLGEVGGGEAGDEPLPLFPCLFRTPPPLDF